MPLRSQGYCAVGRGLSGLHWVRCNGRGPHLEWRQETHFSSPDFPWARSDSDRSFARGEGERVSALESWEGTRASRRVEEGLSRSFSGCGGKPSFPSTSAGDLRELARVPRRGEGCCGVGGAPLGTPLGLAQWKRASSRGASRALCQAKRAPRAAFPSGCLATQTKRWAEGIRVPGPLAGGGINWLTGANQAADRR